MKRFFGKLFDFIKRHKNLSLVIFLVLVAAVVVFFLFFSSDEKKVSYTTDKVVKQMLVSAVSGTGQVSPVNQVDLKAKVSGDVTAVNVKNGQAVKEGDILASVDSRDAMLTVSEAKISLENAQLSLQELLSPADDLTMTQTKNALADAQDNLIKLKTTQANNYADAVKKKSQAEADLDKAYEDAYNTVASAFLDFPDTVTAVFNVLYGYDIADSEWTISSNMDNSSALVNSVLYNDWQTKSEFNDFLDSVSDKYFLAKDSFEDGFDYYKAASRYSPRSAIEDLLDKSIDLAKKLSDALKGEANLMDNWADYREQADLEVFSQVTSFQSQVSSYTSKTNSHLSSLLSAKNSLSDKQDDLSDAIKDLADLDQNQPLELASAERSLAEKEAKLDDLLAGADEIEIRSARLTVEQRRNSLNEAYEALADHAIKAPFDGVVAEVGVKKGDSLGSGTTVVSLITEQNVAIITLNEIDVAQVKIGQPVNLTFDAASDLNITGEVVEVDTLGTTNQGVVSYDIQIIFDVDDERVKPGMTVAASVVTAAKTDCLTVPLSAVKTNARGSYVEILTNGQVSQKTVTTGISDDINIEIIEGLSEGEEIITQTVIEGADNGGNGSDSGPGGMSALRMLR